MILFAYSDMLQLKKDVVHSQVTSVQATFEALNLLTFGSLSPYARAIEALCTTYKATALAKPPSMRQARQVESNIVKQEPVQTPSPSISPNELEIMQRLRPDYSNLRANAEGSRSESILDNDAYWNYGIQGSNAKSPNRIGTERERTMVMQRINEVE